MAALSLGTAVTVRDPVVYIYNNTGRELVIGDYGMLRCQVGKPNAFSYPGLILRGTGTYKFTGTAVQGIIKNTNGVMVSVGEESVRPHSTYLGFGNTFENRRAPRGSDAEERLAPGVVVLGPGGIERGMGEGD